MQDKLQVNQRENNQRRFLCPSCGKHTVLWLLPTTEVKNLPIKCKRCGQENVVSITPILCPSAEICAMSAVKDHIETIV